MDKERECIALGECRPRHASRKDTRRWCRGRVGVEHQWQLRGGKLHSVDQKTGELGFTNEREQCAACGREKFRYPLPRRCHCGVVMTEPEPSAAQVEKWGRARAMRGRRPICTACHYEPSFDIPEWFVNGAYQPERARTKCECEIAAAKAANREKYQRRFTVESGV